MTPTSNSTRRVVYLGALYIRPAGARSGHDDAEIRARLVPIVAGTVGALAAYWIGWLDPRTRTVELEPLGTHRELRRFGLARAIVQELTERSAQRAPKAVMVWVVSTNPGGSSSLLPQPKRLARVPAQAQGARIRYTARCVAPRRTRRETSATPRPRSPAHVRDQRPMIYHVPCREEGNPTPGTVVSPAPGGGVRTGDADPDAGRQTPVRPMEML